MTCQSWTRHCLQCTDSSAIKHSYKFYLAQIASLLPNEFTLHGFSNKSSRPLFKAMPKSQNLADKKKLELTWGFGAWMEALAWWNEIETGHLRVLNLIKNEVIYLCASYKTQVWKLISGRLFVLFLIAYRRLNLGCERQASTPSLSCTQAFNFDFQTMSYRVTTSSFSKRFVYSCGQLALLVCKQIGPRKYSWMSREPGLAAVR